eukprot:GABV01003076.1.p2 GENE.GABV01003076.1~~GABV01003076.1.p2  ORF type:complete len:174 (-),score=62.23 GABV01003076.1:58-579(-)
MADERALVNSACYLEVKGGEDVSSRLEPIQAHDLKNGHWCLDDKTGMPGIISDVKMSKTGKHGHAKFTYKLKMPFTDKSSTLMHAGGDRLERPVMSKQDYEVMNYDADEGDLTVLDGEEELMLKLGEDTETGQKVKELFDKGEVVIVTVLTGPQRLGDNVKLIAQVSGYRQGS